MEQVVRPRRKPRRGSTWDDADIDTAAIARRLVLTRAATGLIKAEFARRAGIWPNSYGQMELNKKNLTIGQAMKMCDAHGLTLDWLYRNKMDGLPEKLTAKIAALRGQNPKLHR